MWREWRVCDGFIMYVFQIKEIGRVWLKFEIAPIKKTSIAIFFEDNLNLWLLYIKQYFLYVIKNSKGDPSL